MKGIIARHADPFSISRDDNHNIIISDESENEKLEELIFFIKENNGERDVIVKTSPKDRAVNTGEVIARRLDISPVLVQIEEDLDCEEYKISENIFSEKFFVIAVSHQPDISYFLDGINLPTLGYKPIC